MFGSLSAILISVAPLFLSQVANVNSSSPVTIQLDEQVTACCYQSEGFGGSIAEESPQPDSLCNPMLYSCTGAEESTLIAACFSAKECATESGACWISQTCYQCLQIKTGPPTYQCSVYYKLP
jgi:hypothetical protein